jgi:hypothetical protein
MKKNLVICIIGCIVLSFTKVSAQERDSLIVLMDSVKAVTTFVDSSIKSQIVRIKYLATLETSESKREMLSVELETAKKTEEFLHYLVDKYQFLHDNVLDFNINEWSYQNYHRSVYNLNTILKIQEMLSYEIDYIKNSPQPK